MPDLLLETAVDILARHLVVEAVRSRLTETERYYDAISDKDLKEVIEVVKNELAAIEPGRDEFMLAYEFLEGRASDE